MREAVKLKRSGVKAGVSDILCLWPARGYVGVAIEFKAAKNKLTASQIEFMKNIEPHGWRCEVWYSFDEAVKFMRWYLGEKDEVQH